jgi:hypothetical protein
MGQKTLSGIGRDRSHVALENYAGQKPVWLHMPPQGVAARSS